jgi:hypothetical protein
MSGGNEPVDRTANSLARKKVFVRVSVDFLDCSRNAALLRHRQWHERECEESKCKHSPTLLIMGGFENLDTCRGLHLYM